MTLKMTEADCREFMIGLVVAGRLGAEIALTRVDTRWTESERRVATGELDLVRYEQWWRDAAPATIVGIYETACVWRSVDAVARDAAQRIRREVRRHYGVDVCAPRAEPAAVLTALTERARIEREAATLDLADASQAMAQACADERAGNLERARGNVEQGCRLYDAAERHCQLARRLTDAPADFVGAV